MKYVFLAGIFITGIILSLFVSDRIALPFENPWNIVGQLALQKYNPHLEIYNYSSTTIYTIIYFILFPQRQNTYQKYDCTRGLL